MSLNVIKMLIKFFVTSISTASEEVSSEVSSFAASSPSVSSRSSLNVSGSCERYVRGDFLVLSSSRGRKNILMDLTNPVYLKPFQYGVY